MCTCNDHHPCAVNVHRISATCIGGACDAANSCVVGVMKCSDRHQAEPQGVQHIISQKECTSPDIAENTPIANQNKLMSPEESGGGLPAQKAEAWTLTRPGWSHAAIAQLFWQVVLWSNAYSARMDLLSWFGCRREGLTANARRSIKRSLSPSRAASAAANQLMDNQNKSRRVNATLSVAISSSYLTGQVCQTVSWLSTMNISNTFSADCAACQPPSAQSRWVQGNSAS